MNTLRIGTAGIPKSATKRSTQEGIKRLAALDLDCMELEFVRSVQMGEKTADAVKATAADKGIALTVHAPYYVNLNSRESDKVKASEERILKAARIGAAAGAVSVTFHAGFYHDDDPGVVYPVIMKRLKSLRTTLNDEGLSIHLRPETTGSVSQFGTLVEIVGLSQEISGVYPCVDFSHLHARWGGGSTYEDFCEVLSFIQTELGPEALATLHMHVSGIEYGDRGEKKHLPFEESDMDYWAVIRALVDFDVGGWLICESPILEDDAILLQQAYKALKEG